MKIASLTSVALVALLTAGCASTSKSEQRAESLREKYQMMVNQFNVEKYAPIALQEADEAISEVERLIDSNADQEDIQHQVYLANRKLDIALETVEMNAAQEFITSSGSARKDLLLSAREREVAQAQAAATVMSARASAAESQAQEMASRVSAAESQVEEMANRAQQLQSEVENLSTRNSERGLILTLGDILFEVGKSELKPGAELTLQKVASFLQEYPERSIVVEGFTDSTGSAEYNAMLSERRALTVKDTLTGMGVSPERINIRGYGEDYPIASNDTAAGRLQNRRVEIVIGKDGDSRVAGRDQSGMDAGE